MRHNVTKNGKRLTMSGGILALAIVVWSLTVAADAPATRPAVTVPDGETRSATAQVLSGREMIDRAVLAHGGSDVWRNLGQATCEIEMQRFDTAGNPAGAATTFGITFPTDGRAEIEAGMGPIRMRYVDGVTTVTNSHGEVTDAAMHARAKFMLPTFQYILSMPWKLQDPGTAYERIADRIDSGSKLAGVRVTYLPGVGDSPDDWYKFYVDEATGRLRDVLWIITAPGHDGTIEWCRFEDQRLVNGLWIPHQWTFVPADESGLVTGPPMMRARLLSVSFTPGGTTQERGATPTTQPTSRPASGSGAEPAPSASPSSRPSNR
jgi:hypothetical protein